MINKTAVMIGLLGALCALPTGTVTTTPLKYLRGDKSGPSAVVVLPTSTGVVQASLSGLELVQVSGIWTLRTTAAASLPVWETQTFRPTATTLTVSLTYTPLPNSETLIRNGQVLTVGEDYTISGGGQLNFMAGLPLESGDLLTVRYQR